MPVSPSQPRGLKTDSAKRAPRPSRRSLSVWTLERMYEFLLEGIWESGQFVNEVAIADDLRVSRSPIRESLAELERDGLVVASPQDGRRQVITFGIRDIEELYDLRVSLERLAIRYLAPTADAYLITELEGLFGEMAAVSPGGLGRERSFAADFEFHQLIVRKADRPRLLGILRPVWMQTRILLADLNRRAIYPDVTEMGRVLTEHGSILEGLKQRDADVADAALVAHLNGAKERVIGGFLAAEHGRREGVDDP